jgi:uncharacterized protein (TIGR00645 family)
MKPIMPCACSGLKEQQWNFAAIAGNGGWIGRRWRIACARAIYAASPTFQDHPMFDRSRQTIESVLEKVLFASRWLLAPFYLGLAAGVGILLIKFMQELFQLAMISISGSESDAILGVLTLVDLALTGSLLLIVIFSGYENFVSKIDHSGHKDWPEWMGTIDFTALKIKLLGSIVAISAIQLLKQFMAVKTASDRELMWYVIIHVVFVVSSVLLAVSDRLSGERQSLRITAPPAAQISVRPSPRRM